MDHATARNFVINQGTALLTQKNPDALLMLLKQGKPPIPGQMTSLLLALKVLFDALKDSPSFDRQLACALHLLAFESRQLFVYGQMTGVDWPPLLDEDLNRLGLAVKSIFTGVWLSLV
jgi:hypothetical protein